MKKILDSNTIPWIKDILMERGTTSITTRSNTSNKLRSSQSKSQKNINGFINQAARLRNSIPEHLRVPTCSYSTFKRNVKKWLLASNIPYILPPHCLIISPHHTVLPHSCIGIFLSFSPGTNVLAGFRAIEKRMFTLFKFKHEQSILAWANESLSDSSSTFYLINVPRFSCIHGKIGENIVLCAY